MSNSNISYRDQAAIRRALGMSFKQAADFSAAGCLEIIARLELLGNAGKELLTAERRGYMDLFTRGAVIPFPMRSRAIAAAVQLVA